MRYQLIRNLEDEIINDTLTVGDISIAEYKRILNDINDTIDKYQQAVIEMIGEYYSLEKEVGKDSIEAKEYLNIIRKVEKNLESLYVDKDTIINKINNVNLSMNEL